MKDGWICSNSIHLFWVPPLLREGLMRPGNRWLVGKVIATRLNFDMFKCGEKWIQCQR